MVFIPYAPLTSSCSVSNIIIQNIKITELNPHYVWGGDAITIAGADMIWIDRVTVSDPICTTKHRF
jgi:pectate lyase